MRDEYLATGFADVDGAENADSDSACLSLLYSLPYFQAYKRRTYELLKLSAGERVLDAGCGLGDDVSRMAEIVGPHGLVIGFDSSARLIEQARSAQRNCAVPVEFRFGDLRHLPFEDGSFTRCRIDRVLQHVQKPQVAICELVRILKRMAFSWPTTMTGERSRSLHKTSSFWRQVERGPPPSPLPRSRGDATFSP